MPIQVFIYFGTWARAYDPIFRAARDFRAIGVQTWREEQAGLPLVMAEV